MLTTILLPLCSFLPQGPQLGAPARLMAGEEFVKVEAPGFAAPCWADTDGDGKKDLVVGQFSKGKMRVFRNLGGGRLETGKWLQAGGKVAEVPGVW